MNSHCLEARHRHCHPHLLEERWKKHLILFLKPKNLKKLWTTNTKKTRGIDKNKKDANQSTVRTRKTIKFGHIHSAPRKATYDTEYFGACLAQYPTTNFHHGSAENMPYCLLYLPDSSELSSSELSEELSESDESSFETGLAAPPPTVASASASSTTLHKIRGVPKKLDWLPSL